eukprot:scaffold266_cov391-Prasinococcus_capsulatus_cf.AAC.36
MQASRHSFVRKPRRSPAHGSRSCALHVLEDTAYRDEIRQRASKHFLRRRTYATATALLPQPVVKSAAQWATWYGRNGRCGQGSLHWLVRPQQSFFKVKSWSRGSSVIVHTRYISGANMLAETGPWDSTRPSHRRGEPRSTTTRTL